MTTSTPSIAPAVPVLNDKVVLKASATAWFLTAVIGQWAFIYYIASFYGASTLQGHFAAWGRNTNLIKGYVAGDQVGNLYFGAHVLIAAMITAGGALQLVPTLRARAAPFHRWNGRLYILTAFLMALGGLWLIWVRGTFLTLYGALASTLLAALIMTGAAMTLRLAMTRRIEAHSRWALRTFVVVNGVWFQRLGYMFWVIVNAGHPIGVTNHMNGPFDLFWGFGSFLLPLAVLELYFRAKAATDPRARFAMAGGLVVVTVALAVGIFGAYMFMWRPLL